MTPDEQIDALIAAGEKATQGEWGVDGWSTDRLIIEVSCIATNDRPEGKRFITIADFNHPGSYCGTYPQHNTHFVSAAANSRSAIKAMRDRNATLEAENARLKEIEEDHQEHIQFWANAAGDEAVYKASWIRAYKKLEAENAALQARVDGARTLIQCLHENDPNSDAADAVTVLDVWRKDAPAWLAQDEQKGEG